MKKFLVGEVDEFDVATARTVIAESADGALEKYMREVESRDSVFREHVIDLAVNMTFVEKFYLSSEQERERFDNGGMVGTEDSIVKSRVKRFFADAPGIGERFIKYMETEDLGFLNDAVFEFIATHDIGWRDGFKAVDVESINPVT